MIDRAWQLLVARRRYPLMRDGDIVGKEIIAANERWYYKHDLGLLLEQVSLHDNQVKGDWTDEEFTDVHESMVLLAIK